MLNLDQLQFPKKGKDIILAANNKIRKLKNKIEDREKSKVKLIEETTDNHARDLTLQSMTRQSTLETEMIEDLGILARNLPADDLYYLPFESIKYLGF